MGRLRCSDYLVQGQLVSVEVLPRPDPNLWRRDHNTGRSFPSAAIYNERSEAKEPMMSFALCCAAAGLAMPFHAFRPNCGA